MQVSCLIPAYNEAGRIGRVLSILRECPSVAEILVIDDGSADATLDEARAALDGEPRARVLAQPQNGGKSRAVARGIAEAQGSHLMLLDADLEGLSPAALDALVAPVRAGHADVSISLRRNAPWVWRAIGLDYISGERVMPRDLLLPRLDEIGQLPGFGLEVFINRIWLERELGVSVVHWPDVASPFKHAKFGWAAGVKADIGMLGDMFSQISPVEALGQIVGMRKQRV